MKQKLGSRLLALYCVFALIATFVGLPPILAQAPSARTLVQGGQASGSTSVTWPVVTAGTTSANVIRTLRTNDDGELVVATSTSGGVQVEGQVAAGGSTTGLFPVLVGGDQSGVLRSLSADSNGFLNVKCVGTDLTGTSTSGNPVQIAGTETFGGTVRTLRVDASGRPNIVGAAASGAAAAGNPVYCGGLDPVSAFAQPLYIGTLSGDILTASSYRPLITFSSPAFLNGTALERGRTANGASGTTGTGLGGSGLMGFDATNWQKVSAGTDGVLKQREVRTTLVALPVLTVAGAYTAGDCFGTKINVTTAAPVSGGTIWIDEITCVDKSDATGNAFDVMFWGTDPSASTFTDNSAPAIDETTDLGNLSGLVRMVSGDFVDVGGAKCGTISASHPTANLPMPVTLAATTLYVVVMAQNANSYAAGDIQFRIKVRQ